MFKLNNKLSDKLIKFAYEYLKNLDSLHGVFHARVTVSYAIQLAKEERGNIDLCIIASWLHDIKRSNDPVPESELDNHGIAGALITQDFLEKELKMEKSDSFEICEAISTHCFPLMQKSLTSKILGDADKLNLFSDEYCDKYLTYLTKELGTKIKAIEKITKERKYYFQYFNTNTAKRIAKDY